MADIKIKYDNTKKSVLQLKKELADKLELCGIYVEGKAIEEITNLDAIETGRLKNSITHETDRNKLSVSIGTNVEYAPYVEFGLGKGNRTPKPFMRNALLKSEDKIIEILKK